MNKDYVRADRRIVLGFIEPHFMAGFSGGYKGVFPAVADIDSIMHFHRAEVIGDASSTWGVLDGNPTQEQIRHNGSLVPVDFLINVTINRQRQITGFFCGETLAAHAQLLAMIRLKARVALLSDIPPDDVIRAHLEPITDVSTCIAEELERIGRNAPIAVLPEGPMTIPYLERR